MSRSWGKSTNSMSILAMADDHYSEKKTARRRDAVVKHMMSKPPQPHSEMKVGKPRRKAGKSPAARRRKKQPE